MIILKLSVNEIYIIQRDTVDNLSLGEYNINDFNTKRGIPYGFLVNILLTEVFTQNLFLKILLPHSGLRLKNVFLSSLMYV